MMAATPPGDLDPLEEEARALAKLNLQVEQLKATDAYKRKSRRRADAEEERARVAAQGAAGQMPGGNGSHAPTETKDAPKVPNRSNNAFARRSRLAASRRHSQLSPTGHEAEGPHIFAAASFYDRTRSRSHRKRRDSKSSSSRRTGTGSSEAAQTHPARRERAQWTDDSSVHSSRSKNPSMTAEETSLEVVGSQLDQNLSLAAATPASSRAHDSIADAAAEECGTESARCSTATAGRSSSARGKLSFDDTTSPPQSTGPIREYSERGEHAVELAGASKSFRAGGSPAPQRTRASATKTEGKASPQRSTGTFSWGLSACFSIPTVTPPSLAYKHHLDEDETSDATKKAAQGKQAMSSTPQPRRETNEQGQVTPIGSAVSLDSPGGPGANRPGEGGRMRHGKPPTTPYTTSSLLWGSKDEGTQTPPQSRARLVAAMLHRNGAQTPEHALSPDDRSVASSFDTNATVRVKTTRGPPSGQEREWWQADIFSSKRDVEMTALTDHFFRLDIDQPPEVQQVVLATSLPSQPFLGAPAAMYKYPFAWREQILRVSLDVPLSTLIETTLSQDAGLFKSYYRSANAKFVELGKWEPAGAHGGFVRQLRRTSSLFNKRGSISGEKLFTADVLEEHHYYTITGRTNRLVLEIATSTPDYPHPLHCWRAELRFVFTESEGSSPVFG
mmetsp:Transcript_10024/g.36659  ORF Transcript_10024/g.36659 Transcript_10024/m.36659 type:complete len:674 (-) Transcript_10024:399-2420(-)